MALKQVSRGGGSSSNEQTTGDAIRTAKMGVGESIKGYITKIVPKEENADHANLIMKLVDTGELKMIFTSGNLAYAAGVDQLLVEGLYTEIVREEDFQGVSKAGKKFARTSFKIAQDDERTLGDALFNEIGEQPATVSKPATPPSTAASRAAALTKSVTQSQAGKRG